MGIGVSSGRAVSFYPIQAHTRGCRRGSVRRFEGRFQSVATLDEESLPATWADIDLNPVAAGIAEVPEASSHSSIKERVEHVREQDRAEDLKAAEAGSVAGSQAAEGLEEDATKCWSGSRPRLEAAPVKTTCSRTWPHAHEFPRSSVGHSPFSLWFHGFPD